LYLQYGRYLLISSSRPGTRPANLQGIWNDLLNPPWGSKYTTNINLEMNYWPAEALNLSPMHEPLFQMLKELSQTGSKRQKIIIMHPVGYYIIIRICGGALHRSTQPIMAFGLLVVHGCADIYGHIIYLRRIKIFYRTQLTRS
jgi:hypothetical protein